jgi:predicted AlkP superfamily phosphohydrolase/phosphomutase/tetratricopeptide (TPR) repeat protein
MPQLAKKVLLIGWDSADWKIINNLIDKGMMPALESMVNNGVMGNLSTLEPPFSPILWTSIATGKLADKHGILGFTEPDPSGAGVRPITSASRKVKAIWNILMQKGFKSHVVGWWPSHPAEPIDGIMISNHYHHVTASQEQWKMASNTVHPENLSELFEHLRIHPAEFTDEILLPFVPLAAKIDQSKDKRLYNVAKILAEASTIQSAATWIMENTEWDFMGIYFDAIDHFCHGFMNYHPPKMKNVSEEDFELYKDVVSSAYRYHDMMLEHLLKIAGKDTTVILISDHGFHSDHLRPAYIPDEPAGPAFQHRNHGVICIKGPNIKKDEIIYGASLLNITPTILTLFGLPTGKDMDGIPLLQIFDKPVSIETIDSWENVPGDCGMLPSDQIVDPVEAQKALQQLIDLGYIEDPGKNKIIAAQKSEEELNYNLVRVFIGSNRNQKAIPLLEKLLSAKADEGRYAVRLARSYLETGNYTACEEVINTFKDNVKNKLLTIEQINEIKNQAIPDDLDENKKQNILHENHSKLRKNGSYINYLRQIDLIFTDLLISKNESAKAVTLIENNFADQKHSPDVLIKLGNAFINMKKWDKALECFQNALKIDPESEHAFHGLSIISLNKKEFETAANYALDAIGLNYYYPYAHFHLGEALYQLKDYENSANAFEVCLKMVPDFGKARNRLIKIYKECLEKPQLAEKHKKYFEKKQEPSLLDDNDKTELYKDAIYSTKHIALKDPIIIVSGLPRSGTSLMMQMLEKGGMDIFTDNKRASDENNPRGYFEHEAVKSLARNNKWLSQVHGKAVKIIAQLIQYLPARYNYKIIFMERDIYEIVSSQQKMLVRDGKFKAKSYPGGLDMIYSKQVENAKSWINNRHNMDVLYINYKDAIENPSHVAEQVNSFLNSSMDINAMVKAIDVQLYREKNK